MCLVCQLVVPQVCLGSVAAYNVMLGQVELHVTAAADLDLGKLQGQTRYKAAWVNL